MNKTRLDKLEAAWRSCMRVMFNFKSLDKIRCERIFEMTAMKWLEDEVKDQQSNFIMHIR